MVCIPDIPDVGLKDGGGLLWLTSMLGSRRMHVESASVADSVVHGLFRGSQPLRAYSTLGKRLQEKCSLHPLYKGLKA